MLIKYSVCCLLLPCKSTEFHTLTYDCYTNIYILNVRNYRVLEYRLRYSNGYPFPKLPGSGSKNHTMWILWIKKKPNSRLLYTNFKILTNCISFLLFHNFVRLFLLFRFSLYYFLTFYVYIYEQIITMTMMMILPNTILTNPCWSHVSDTLIYNLPGYAIRVTDFGWFSGVFTAASGDWSRGLYSVLCGLKSRSKSSRHHGPPHWVSIGL